MSPAITYDLQLDITAQDVSGLIDRENFSSFPNVALEETELTFTKSTIMVWSEAGLRQVTSERNG